MPSERNRASNDWKKRNPEKNRAQVKRWRAKNPERAKENARRWYLANRERLNAKSLQYAKDHPDLIHDMYLKWTYGAPHGTYARLLAEQQGGCAICGATEPGRKLKRFHLDHCHDTKRIRGLLCGNCNVGIAHLKHSKEVLLAAISYLSKNSCI